MKTVDLTPLMSIDDLVLLFNVQIDDIDLDRVRTRKWKITNYGYVISDVVNRQKIQLHRLLLSPNDNQYVDHINRDKLDNRRVNLRICNFAENIRNRSVLKSKALQVKGVRSKKKNGLYEVRIKQENIGYFSSLEAAKNAYNFYAKKTFR
jgi:hypothetical protein